MSNGFFVTGQAAIERHAQIAERDRIHHEKQTAEAGAVEAVIQDDDNDREAAQLIALAQLLSPDCWASRSRFLEMAEAERASNVKRDPRAEQRHRNMAALTVEYSLTKARRARDMVRSWG